MTEDEMRWLNGMSDLDTSLSKSQIVKDREAWCAVVHGVRHVGKESDQLSD